MLLIFPVPVGTCKCFVCASGYIGEGVGGGFTLGSGGWRAPFWNVALFHLVHTF